MGFSIFKNTVLFKIGVVGVLLVFGCKHSLNNNKLAQSKDVGYDGQKEVILANNIVVGANRTSEYIDLLKGKNVAVVANQTSVIFKNTRPKTANVHIVDSLLSLNIRIKKVFAPEHGFRGKADAGELVKDGFDVKTGLTIHSLHGKYKKPTTEQLKNIDVVVFDIQDVGVRFYTYISTLHYVMEACAENDIPLVILDRPNPNGNYMDGPTLKKEHSSFLGMHPIPLVHGMTIGEYAQMINGEKWLSNGVTCDISVIELENYTHSSTYSLPILPSPNLPNDQSITLYPSLGLFEGTNINAGRGTESQFQRYGAPFLDNNHYNFSYIPKSNFGAKYPKHKGEICYGVDLSSEKAERKFTLKYVIDAYTNSTDKSRFFNTSNFTKHAGTEILQQQVEAGLSEKEIRDSWKAELNKFKKMRQKYLIYSR